MTTHIKGRLEFSAALLELIDRRRVENGDAHLGASIEHMLIERELHELEQASAQARPSTAGTLTT